MYTSGVVIVAKQKAMVVRLHEMFRQACLHATTLNQSQPYQQPKLGLASRLCPTARGLLVVLNLQSIVCHLLVLLQDSSGWPCSAFA